MLVLLGSDEPGFDESRFSLVSKSLGAVCGDNETVS
jgi:hypothetical protein